MEVIEDESNKIIFPRTRYSKSPSSFGSNRNTLPEEILSYIFSFVLDFSNFQSLQIFRAQETNKIVLASKSKSILSLKRVCSSWSRAIARNWSKINWEPLSYGQANFVEKKIEIGFNFPASSQGFILSKKTFDSFSNICNEIEKYQQKEQQQQSATAEEFERFHEKEIEKISIEDENLNSFFLQHYLLPNVLISSNTLQNLIIISEYFRPLQSKITIDCPNLKSFASDYSTSIDLDAPSLENLDLIYESKFEFRAKNLGGKLRKLSLEFTDILIKKDFPFLFEILPTLKNLESLSLVSYFFRFSDFHKGASYSLDLKENKNLQEIRISDINLENLLLPENNSISQVYCHCSMLQSLNIDNFKSIRNLNFGYLDFLDENMLGQILENSRNSLQEIRLLTLSRLKKVTLFKISNLKSIWIEKCQELKSLLLSDSNIVSHIYLGDCEKLEKLDIGCCLNSIQNLVLIGLASSPEFFEIQIPKMKKLKILHLESVKIAGNPNFLLFNDTLEELTINQQKSLVDFPRFDLFFFPAIDSGYKQLNPVKKINYQALFISNP